MAVAHLLNRHLRHHRTRAALTIAAIMVAVSLVVALTTSFASLRGAAYDVLGTMYGSTDLQISPDQQRGTMIDEATVAALRKDDRVRHVDARRVATSSLLDADDKPVHWRPSSIIGIEAENISQASVDALIGGQWFDQSGGEVAVIEEKIAEKLKIGVGDSLGLPSPTGTLRLKVVGVLGRPDMLHFEAPAVYLPIATLQRWLGETDTYSEVKLDLVDSADADEMAAEIQQRVGPGVYQIETAASRQRNFERNFAGLTVLSYLGGTLSMIAAVFIVFSALTMGVTERSRSLGMLRAIGATRGQIATLVIGEGVALAVIGAAMGVPLGVGWVMLLNWMYPRLFSAGVVFSFGGAVYGAAGTITAALAASLLPAWVASRSDVLDALTVTSRPRKGRSTMWCGIAGVVLIALDPLIVFTPGIGRELRMDAHLFIGLPALLIGLVGIAPLLVIAADRMFSSAVARVMKLEPTLLRQQLSGGLWRTVGTAAGLMVGLLALVVLQTHGRSMATGWSMPAKFPDMLMVAPMGLDQQQIDTMQTLEQIRPPGVLAMAMVTPQFATNIFGLGGMMKMPEGTMLFGMDTDRAFGDGSEDAEPMIELQYIEGDPDTARKLLKQGHHVIVSEHYTRVKGMGVGDVIKLNTPLSGEVGYTIAGVVRSVGIDMVVRLFEMRREFDRFTAAGAITTLEDVQRDFGTQRIYLMCANVDASVNKRQFERRLRDKLRTWGVLAADARKIKRGVDTALGGLLDLISTIALAAIGVAALGVTNTIIASVRSRRWQMGVLRSLGLTRGAMTRLILAEAVMIGAVASVLGIGGGLLLSLDANHLSIEIIGYVVPLTIPWGVLAMGVGLTLGVAMLAALRPAIGAARSDTLSLLQAGRASE